MSDSDQARSASSALLLEPFGPSPGVLSEQYDAELGKALGRIAEHREERERIVIVSPT